MKKLSILALSAVLGLSTLPMIASASGDHAPGHAPTSSEATSATSATAGNVAATEGEIRKVDKEQGKITIKHAELKNLDMPAMTMVFQVKDKSMLEQVKAGDQISFVADKIEGKFTVMQLDVKK